MNQHKYFELKLVDTPGTATQSVVAPQFALRPVPAESDADLKIIPVQVMPNTSEQRFFLFGQGKQIGVINHARTNPNH
ncbi:MAG: hypothetical protein ABFS56_13415 [Pseudomonadota bacterium]